jgi:hypothetical protein
MLYSYPRNIINPRNPCMELVEAKGRPAGRVGGSEVIQKARRTAA